MNKEKESARWIYCPLFDSKTRTKVCENTVMFNFPLLCPKCKTETRVDVMQLKIAESKDISR